MKTFTRNGDKAKWKSTSDQGEVTVSGPALYWSLGGTPAAYSVAFAAVGKRSDGKLPLIPGGTLTIRKVADAQVTRGADHRKVTLMSITGVGLTPAFVWSMNEATPRLFAFIVPGFLQLIEEGWETNAKALETQQKKAEGDVVLAMQKRLAHNINGRTLIRNARVFDSKAAKLGPASDVLLRDGGIVSVTATGQPTPKAGQVVDAGGRVLLPGLFDMHGHLGRWDGGLNLAAGITTVRDMGNDNATLQQLMAQERAGTLMMPRIVPAGFIEGESKMSSSGVVLSSPRWPKRRRRSTGTPRTAIRKSRSTTLSRRNMCARRRLMRTQRDFASAVTFPHSCAQEAVEQGYDEI